MCCNATEYQLTMASVFLLSASVFFFIYIYESADFFIVTFKSPKVAHLIFNDTF